MKSGPDGLTSWLIACACCFINMMMYGMARLSGVLFVASVPRFNVGREKASFPYTFASFMRNTSGPLVGYLGHKFGVRTVTTFGCLLAALGAGTCYLAEDISTVTVLWGAVFGLGFGLGNILLPVAINQYFDKHRATASGISFSGACLGSFILPPIVEILLNKYGLSGTYLFLSGFLLNCVPAALLLKKPSFQVKASDPGDCERGERQSIISSTKVKLYTVENALSSQVVREKDIEKKPVVQSQSVLSYEERMKRLSTQTLLSDYSIHLSTSDPVDDKEIIENCKGRRQVDPSVFEAESISSETNQDLSFENDEVFEKETRSSSVQYEKPLFKEKLRTTRSLSSNSFVQRGGHSHAPLNNDTYQNYGYQSDPEDKVNTVYSTFSKLDVSSAKPGRSNSNETNSQEYQIISSSLKSSDPYVASKMELPKSRGSILSADNFTVRYGTTGTLGNTVGKDSSTESPLGAFSVILDPMFILIAITNAIYCFTFVCMITVVVDFARDLNIGVSNEKYILMALSVGDLIGRLGLGWITDRGYMTRTGFASFCFACQGLATAAVAWSDGFISLIVLITLYGLSEAGLILIFPIIIAQFIEEEKQAVAIPSSNFLSGPLCLAVSPLIGYFRDEVGSYEWIFYGIGIVSALCCVSWMFAPCIAKCQKKR